MIGQINAIATIVFWGSFAGIVLALAAHFGASSGIRATIQKWTAKVGLRGLIFGAVPVGIALNYQPVAEWAIAAGLVIMVTFMAGLALALLGIARSERGRSALFAPFALFIALAAVLAILPYFYYFDEGTSVAKALLARGTPVTGTILERMRTRQWGSRKVRIRIPGAPGSGDCTAYISVDEYDALASDKVGVFIEPGPTLLCSTRSAMEGRAARSVAANALLSLLVGLLMAVIPYWMIVRVPFGSPSRPLKARWKTEAGTGN